MAGPADPKRTGADDANVNPKRIKFSIWYVLLGLWAVLILQQIIYARLETTTLAYTEFKAAVTAGQVESVEVSPTVIRGHRRSPAPGGSSEKDFLTVRVEDPTLVPALAAAGVKVTGVLEKRTWSEMLSWVLPLALFVAFGVWSMRRIGQGGAGAGFLTVGRNKAKVYMEKDVGVRFTDVAGVDEAKEELREVIEFLTNPERFSRLGAHIPKGVLLVGPPGTGKTLLARAVAGEASVPFFSISGSEFVEMFVGVGAARVRDLFEQAKSRAPCIIFIDELDALGKARHVGPMAHEEREQTLNQLLVEMDGFDPSAGVILMAATNRPEILDPALLRAGRFDRHVLVDRPDKAGRLAILKVHAKKIVLDAQASLEEIAGMTAGFVGADLANIVNEAALLGVRRGKDKVTRAELQEAVERVVAGLEKKNRVLLPAEKERVAHHEVGHALVAMAMPGADAVQKISIIPRGIAALGYTLQTPTEDRYLLTAAELENKIAILLGGRSAEELIYDSVSTGAQDDLAKATDIARAMVKTYGMSPALGARTFDPDRAPLFLDVGESRPRGDYSEETSRTIDAEVRRIVEAQHERALAVLRQRPAALRAAAALLLQRETLSGDELRAAVEGHPGTTAA